ncbi:MAG: terminase small subunit [Bacillota bacterium]
MPDNVELAYQDYLRGMKYIEIAQKYNVSLNTVKSWKQRYKWDRKSVHTNEKVCTQKMNRTKKDASRKANNDQSEDGPDLTAKQVLFVAEYLTDFNATRAAMAVGCNKKSAAVMGFRLLRNDNVQAEIKRQTELVASDLGVTSQRLLLEYLKIAFADITNFVEFGQKEVPVMGAFGPVIDKKTKRPFLKTISYVAFKESTDLDGTLISEVKQGKDGVSIKLHDKMKALEKLEKYLDLLPDHHKRMIEEKKLELAREQFELDKSKINGSDDQPEDDGFMEALEGKVSEVWGDDEE